MRRAHESAGAVRADVEKCDPAAPELESFRHLEYATVEILLASLLSPITLSFVAGIFAARMGLEIRAPARALQLFANLLMFAIGIDGGRGLASSDPRSLGAGLAVALTLIVLMPALSYVIARYLARFSAADSVGLAALYGSVSSAVLMAAYAESDDMDLTVDGFVVGVAALMEFGLLVALMIGTFALGRTAGTITSNVRHIANLAGGGFLLLVLGLLTGWSIGDQRFGRFETALDLVLTGALAFFMLEMGTSTARELRKLRAAGVRVVSFALVMPVVGAILGTFLATLAGLSPGSTFVLGAVAASASFINAPPLVRMWLPAANPSIYLTCALGVTFPVLLLIGLPLIAHMALFWQRLIEPGG